MRALFLQHDHLSPPGPVAERFAARGYAVDEAVVVAPEDFHQPNQPFDFPDPRGYDALVVMGAPWGAWDDDTIGTWLLPELEWLREADELNVPVFGICFGGQLLARAHGGSVARAPRPQIGWTPVWTQEPELVGPGPWFEWHYDRWQVPPDARELARDALASQAFVLRRNLAVQFHPELTAAGLQGWFDNGGRDAVVADGQDPQVLYQHTLAEGQAAADRAHALVDAFLDRVATA
ncbi:MAG: type 1 glutamine amidotransferase [Candidatus Nanopelagicales bacterium]|jgi:GMP synthase-like glutamine amidotransferase